MIEPLTDVDRLLLARWADANAMWEAILELEERLGNRLEAIADRLRPWLESRGYMLLDVQRRYANVNVGKRGWMKKREEPLIYISVAALYPFGYCRVDEEHPYVWLLAHGLSDDEQVAFQTYLTDRLKSHSEGWINEHCGQDSPAGRYVTSHGDSERIALAQSDEALEAFIRNELEPMLALGGEIDAALVTARPQAAAAFG